MVLAIATSPAGVTSTAAVATLTTVAFTPPVGSLLLVSVNSGYDSSAKTAAITTVTGSTSAWTKAAEQSYGSTCESGFFWATVTSSISTTIRSTWSSTGPCGLKVYVLTGANNAAPIGQITPGLPTGGQWFSGQTTQTLTYVATAIGSIGFFGSSDGGASPLISFGANTTSDNSFSATVQLRQSHQTTPAAALTTQSFVCAMPSDSDGYCFVEVLPGVAAPAGFTGWGQAA